MASGGTNRGVRAGGAANDAPPKVMLCITEDWFALSHFKPLIRALAGITRELVVVTRSSGRVAEIEALGARVVELDYLRSTAHPLKVWQAARALRKIIGIEKPNCIHLVALKPIVTGAMALAVNRQPSVAIHLTGLGLLSIASTPREKVVRRIATAAVRTLLRRPRSWLFVENEDDLAVITKQAAAAADHVTVLGGAGVDPDVFSSQPPPANDPPTVAFVGRMIRSKGVDTLVEAARLAQSSGTSLRLELYGKIDHGNPEAFTEAEIRVWESNSLTRWHGHVDDVRQVWSRSDIFVMAPLGGEGMPRAMLEAASCGRPLIVTDVPGCRTFVRNGVEGFVVPTADPQALADAIRQLATDPHLRARMGAAARERVLSAFTEAHVMTDVTRAYEALRRL